MVAPAIPGRDAPRLPVSVITGFLGSGKTTLLANLLRHPAMARTAVIINELGEIGLDHELIETSDEQVVQLTTGCLCCAIRTDLTRTLADLLARRAAGSVPPFERIAIETSGLAEPGPILQALMLDGLLAEALRIEGVVTLVDAVNGADVLDRYPEAVKQVAVADRLLVSKTDLSSADAVRDRLACLNPDAPVLDVRFGQLDPEQLFGIRAELDPSALVGGHGHEHSSGIAAVTLIRDRPIPALALTLFLQALAENCGDALLRLKGIVAVAECPDRPAVIHGVQHVFHPPAWLPRWPTADRRSRIVLIGRNIPRSWPDSLLAILEEEARAATIAMAAKGG